MHSRNKVRLTVSTYLPPASTSNRPIWNTDAPWTTVGSTTYHTLQHPIFGRWPCGDKTFYPSSRLAHIACYIWPVLVKHATVGLWLWATYPAIPASVSSPRNNFPSVAGPINQSAAADEEWPQEICCKRFLQDIENQSCEQ